MKDFHRSNPLFSLCGLNCALCGLRLGGHCPGCGGGNRPCAIARCAETHGGAEYCFECGEYPCERYEGFANYDSFVVCRNRANDIERARTIGMAAYTNEIAQKLEILKYLIENFNDGRRKTFFMAAASLLTLEELQDAVRELNPPEDWDIKRRAIAATIALNEVAARRGVIIKLNKKPAKKEKQ